MSVRDTFVGVSPTFVLNEPEDPPHLCDICRRKVTRRVAPTGTIYWKHMGGYKTGVTPPAERHQPVPVPNLEEL
jgi:hypothetical protein